MKFGINNPAWLQSAGNTVVAAEPLCITSLEDGNEISVSGKKLGTFYRNVSYSTDKTNWTPLTNSSTFTLNNGDTLYFTNSTGVNSTLSSNNLFTISKKYTVSGDLVSLFYPNESSEYKLGKCFSGTSVVSASDLVLNLKVLKTSSIFSGLFQNCTLLVDAPQLPATTLSAQCYNNMFYGCTSLVNAPQLPATVLVSQCYNSMFYGCTSLENAPALPATTLAESCYSSMFSGCTSLVTAPELPATNMLLNCYQNMFNGCTSLANAPQLPATALASQCYNAMFSGCTSLVTAPALPATTLDSSCYSYMFRDCTSLANAPQLPAAVVPGGGYASMFDGCSNINKITCLATDISATNAIMYWLRGVSSTGTFTKATGVAWTTGESGIPTGWTVVEQ